MSTYTMSLRQGRLSQTREQCHGDRRTLLRPLQELESTRKGHRRHISCFVKLNAQWRTTTPLYICCFNEQFIVLINTSDLDIRAVLQQGSGLNAIEGEYCTTERDSSVIEWTLKSGGLIFWANHSPKSILQTT